MLILAIFFGTIARSKKKIWGSTIILNMLMAWGLFALLWVVLKVTGLEPPGYLIHQPANLILFWIIGAALMALQVSISSMAKL